MSRLRAVLVRVRRPERWSSTGRRRPARCLVLQHLFHGSATGQATGVVWLATGQVAPTVPPPDPAVAGAQAASELQLPIPTLTLSPAATGYVNLAEWLWIDATVWHSLSTTAQACNAGGCVTATATATPAYVTWDTGDGSTVTCNGPGTPYDPALPATPSRRPARTPTPPPRPANRPPTATRTMPPSRSPPP